MGLCLGRDLAQQGGKAAGANACKGLREPSSMAHIGEVVQAQLVSAPPAQSTCLQTTASTATSTFILADILCVRAHDQRRQHVYGRGSAGRVPAHSSLAGLPWPVAFFSIEPSASYNDQLCPPKRVLADMQSTEGLGPAAQQGQACTLDGARSLGVPAGDSHATQRYTSHPGCSDPPDAGPAASLHQCVLGGVTCAAAPCTCHAAVHEQEAAGQQSSLQEQLSEHASSPADCLVSLEDCPLPVGTPVYHPTKSFSRMKTWPANDDAASSEQHTMQQMRPRAGGMGSVPPPCTACASLAAMVRGAGKEVLHAPSCTLHSWSLS